MNKRILAVSGMLWMLPWMAWADQAVYCPQNHGYITVGMTVAQVTAACGEPLSKQDSNQPLMKQVPVLQIYYNNVGATKAFYGVWAIPIGNSSIGKRPFGDNSGGGVKLEVNIINNKVSLAKINGSSSNAFSICSGANIQVGDPVGRVYGACGTPSLVNRTFINQAIPSQQKPQIWVYQTDQYQSPLSLTFLDGKLQSIN